MSVHHWLRLLAFPMRTSAFANGQTWDLPVPAQGASTHARFFDPAGPAKPCDIVLGCVAFRLRNSVGTRNFGFRGSMAGLCPPLPTLRRRSCERQRTARGRCGSLRLHRVGLSPTTPCRSPGALRIRSAPGGGFELRCDEPETVAAPLHEGATSTNNPT